ncbi:MAG TPA: MoxR family ATPase [Oligoflexia bacterium]|nr:MoxR family ATPase [Oligoflexia bacterium]HMR24337.1 MoxR family ATPase [Oligoflexia bacterium]
MKYQEQCQSIISQIKEYYCDHQNITPLLMASFLVKGHVLIEGPPGTGKTSLAKMMSVMLSKSFSRIQCTSDLLPQDITGYSILRGDQLEFVSGPVFSDFLLVDELNRASPRAQSALLEAMEERQVSIDGKTHDLGRNFFVIATQNPQDHEGTFPLPEVQLDRFLLCINTEHANKETEQKLLQLYLDQKIPIDFSIIQKENLDLDQVFAEILKIKIDQSLVNYITDLLEKTRKHELIAYGASLRAGLALVKCAQALAYLNGRAMVVPDDIKLLAKPVLSHRLALSSQAIFQNMSKDACINAILMELPFPS